MDINSEFRINDIPYPDASKGYELLLDGAGKFRIGVLENGITDGAEQAVINAIPRAFKFCGERGIPYNTMAHDPESFTMIMNGMLAEEWDQKGIAVMEFYFTELYPDEASVKAIINEKKNPSDKLICHVCGADMSHLQGGDLCTQCGTKLVGRRKQRICGVCGADMSENNGDFCTKCGARLDGGARLICPVCGTDMSGHSGDFCTRCGARLNGGKKLICQSCGADMSGKTGDFCTKCGAKLVR